MMRVVLALLACVLVNAANAQQLNPQTTAPAYATGCAILSATNSSVLLSTASLCTNSNGWPTTNNMIYIKNVSASAGTFYVCPFGGACTSSNGIAIEAGTSYGLYMHNPTSMTGISASTSTVDLQW